MTTIILKVTERCNSNCYYCDVVRKPGTGTTMSMETYEVVIRRVDEYLTANPEDQIEVLWHGGEPLLVGPEYFDAAARLHNDLSHRVRRRVRHSIQSNLTVFAEPFVEPLRALGITALGTSFDPSPHVRGPGADIDSDWYNTRFLRGLSLLEQCGFDWGMIYVVTQSSLRNPAEIFHCLTNLSPSGGINFNPVLIYDEHRQDVAVTAEDLVAFLGAILPLWLEHRQRYPGVEPFRSLWENIVEGHTRLGCVDSGRCTYHHINIAPNGETSQCGRSADWGLLPYGNIADRPLADILGDEQRGQLEERQSILRAGDCQDCRFWDICHGGCPLDAYSKHKDFNHKSEWCEARRGFIRDHFEPSVGVRFEHRERPRSC